MHIHLDMTASQYLPVHHHQDSQAVHLDTNCLGEGPCSSQPPTTAAYAAQDVTPCSAASSRLSPFSYPAVTDPTLLTPVSNAASPPLQHRGIKPMESYVPSSVSGPQQPTPPASSRVFYYETNVSSQSSSPMTVQPQCTEAFEMSGYIDASPTEELPPPQMTPYFGAYGVSDPTDPECVSHMGGDQYGYVQASVEVDHGNFLVRHEPGLHADAATPHQRGLGPLVTPHPSLLQHPNPGQFRSYRPGNIEDIGGPMLQVQPHQMHPNQRRRRPSSRQKGVRRAMRPIDVAASPGHQQAHASSSGGPGEGQDNGKPRLQLSDKATEQERYLLSLYQGLTDEKGKGMWDTIQSRFDKTFPSDDGMPSNKAKLQMRLGRAVTQHGIWPEGENDILARAFQQVRSESYSRIAAVMKDMGGGRIHDWRPAHIEAQLVKLGLEELESDETTKLRKRNRNAQRRRTAAAAAAAAQHQDAVVTWSSMNLPHPQFALPQPMLRRPSYEAMGDGIGIPHYTSEQENELYGQLERKYPTFGEDSSPDRDVKMRSAPEDEPERHAPKLNHAQSERVARQACEQLMARNLKNH